MDNNNEIVKKVFLIAVFILSIFTIVFFSRYDIDLSQDFSQWVNVAVYFNNIVTPILMFLSVFLLFLTWKNTREELVNTREILQKQMDMQVNSKKLEELELMFEKLNGFVFEHKWMNARAHAYFESHDDFFNQYLDMEANQSSASLLLNKLEFKEIFSQAWDVLRNRSLMEILKLFKLGSLEQVDYFSPIGQFSGCCSENDCILQYKHSRIGSDLKKRLCLDAVVLSCALRTIKFNELVVILFDIHNLISDLKTQGEELKCELLSVKYDLNLITDACWYRFELDIHESFFGSLLPAYRDYDISEYLSDAERVYLKNKAIFNEFKRIGKGEPSLCSSLQFLLDRYYGRQYWIKEGTLKGFLYQIYDYKGIFKHSERFSE